MVYDLKIRIFNMPRCPCQTRAFRQCNNNIIRGGEYCYVHTKCLYKHQNKERYEKNYEEFECPICYCSEHVFDKCILPCGHVFCSLCVKSWFKTNKNSCPMCRALIPVKFIKKYDCDFDKRVVMEKININIVIEEGTINQQRDELGRLIGVLQRHYDLLTE